MRKSLHLGICAAGVFVLAGCGERSEELAVADTDAGAEPQPIAERAALPPERPPPSRDEQLRAALFDLGATPTERGLSIILPSAEFAPGSVHYDAADAPTLDRVIDLMREQPAAWVLIVGHTDSRGDAATNQQLSRRRAEAVHEVFVARGIDVERMSVEAAGETRPVASNDTEAGRQANRRVELVFPRGDRRAGTAEAAPQG